ncbi:hypothetical protein IWW48_005989 [Coemansia sp. RSA 1200]|nr:hypothetical protein IWW48_005989 [Coemansia sp. RSA 1200]
MSSWLGLSVGIPLGIGLGASYKALRPGASGWHSRLHKPKYNVPHSMLLPLFTALYTIEGVATYLVSNEMVLGNSSNQETAVVVQAGHWGLAYYWLSLTFLVFWPALVASGPMYVKAAMADISLAVVLQLLALVQFFRLSTAGGLLHLLCFFVTHTLAVWNLALIQKSRARLPL